MSGLSDTQRTKLVKLLGMLNSTFDNERATAAALADRLIRERNLTWEHVIARTGERQHKRYHQQAPSRPSPRRPWRDVAADCSRQPWRGQLTAKQQVKLNDIAERLGVEPVA
jgi:hypothetical protein